MISENRLTNLFLVIVSQHLHNTVYSIVTLPLYLYLYYHLYK